jgi:uncharacterized membrane protein SirB2
VKEALPFLFQGLVMGVDEFYCHRRREMRRWERVGHPLDTLVFLSALSLLLIFQPSPKTLVAFAVASLVSCLFITKDEWQHRELCTGFENWLHALLFLVHPVVLIWAGWLWWSQDPGFTWLVGGMAGLSAVFALYQTLYWNFLK